MLDTVGTGKSGAPLVLAELNNYEKEALYDLLWSAERALETGVAKNGRRRDEGVRAMIAELRRVHGITED